MEQGFLQRVEAFLAEAAMPPSIFGYAAVRDPRLVTDLRAGRIAGLRIICRVEHFMNKWRADHRAGRVRPRGDRRLRTTRQLESQP